MRIFIPGNVVSSKNHKIITFNKYTKKPMVIDTKAVKTYKKATRSYWVAEKNNFLNQVRYKKLPYKIVFQFVRETKHSFDFVNMLQLPLDMMVQFGWLIDDNYLNIIPVIHPEVIFDKHNPGLFISIQEPKQEEQS